MRRREFLQLTGSATLLTTMGTSRGVAAAMQPNPVRRHLRLSRSGCNRATAYSESNKIVTLGSKTHVSWLDVTDEGYHVRVRTLDRATGRLSRTYTIGEAHDNHGGPALTADSEGYLHVAYYPHHHPMRYRRSKRPNDASEWTDVEIIGERCTYPTLVCGADDTLYLTCRESGRPWSLSLYRRPAGDGKTWEGPQTILESRFGGYAQWQASLAWGPDPQALHLACRIYEKDGQFETLGYLRSKDGGQSWQRYDGTRVDLPATAETVNVLVAGSRSTKEKPSVKCRGLVVDKHDVPYMLYSVRDVDSPDMRIVWPGEEGWQHRSLRPQLPSAVAAWDVGGYGGLSLDAQGTIVAVGTALSPARHGKERHPGSKVVGFTLRPPMRASRVEAHVISQLDEQRSHWMPNVERSTGHHTVSDEPCVVYMAGGAEKNNDVYLAVGGVSAG